MRPVFPFSPQSREQQIIVAARAKWEVQMLFDDTHCLKQLLPIGFHQVEKNLIRQLAVTGGAGRGPFSGLGAVWY